MRQAIVPELEGDEYVSWEARQPDRHELHYGFVVALAGGTSAHSTVASNVLVALRRAYPAPCVVHGSDFKIQVASSTFYYPDVSVVCESVGDDATSTRRPVVVVEVLSRGTRGYDLIDKRANYRTLETLVAYLAVDSEARRVELDARAMDRWRTELVDDAFALGDTTITLDELYAQTSFA